MGQDVCLEDIGSLSKDFVHSGCSVVIFQGEERGQRGHRRAIKSEQVEAEGCEGECEREGRRWAKLVCQSEFAIR